MKEKNTEKEAVYELAECLRDIGGREVCVLC